MPTIPFSIEIVNSITSIPSTEWNRLASGHPLLSHTFLDGLHRAGCASTKSGWTPQYLLLKIDGKLEGAMPLYLKNHSYGEYVFDWAWANAYEQASLDYYPKLLCAIPFSPVTGQRLLVSQPQYRGPLIDAAIQMAKENNLSSFHCLFPNEQEATEFQARGLLQRTGVQFHWHNAGYESFEQFLASMTHDKRKKIRQERRKIAEAGINFRRLTGGDIQEEDWQFFYRCYVDTYLSHRSSPYLSLDFFLHLGKHMPEQVLLIIAEQNNRPIASAFNLFNHETLYGRYWGTTAFVTGLHFETCYYQAIEFCIERGIARFEGGAQGEHKLARGFTPVKTLSMHWLTRPEFSLAVENFLARETRGVSAYIDELNERQPFK